MQTMYLAAETYFVRVIITRQDEYTPCTFQSHAFHPLFYCRKNEEIFPSLEARVGATEEEKEDFCRENRIVSKEFR